MLNKAPKSRSLLRDTTEVWQLCDSERSASTGSWGSGQIPSLPRASQLPHCPWRAVWAAALLTLRGATGMERAWPTGSCQTVGVWYQVSPRLPPPDWTKYLVPITQHYSEKGIVMNAHVLNRNNAYLQANLWISYLREGTREYIYLFQHPDVL